MTPRWPLKRTVFWHQAPFFRLLLPLITGIIAYDAAWIPRAYDPVVPLAASITLFIVLACMRRHPLHIKFFVFLLLQFMLCCTGWWLCRQHDIRQDKHWFARSGAHYKTWLIKVSAPPVERERVWQLQADLLKGIDDHRSSEVTGKAMLSVFKTDSPFRVEKGDLLLVPGDWQPVKNAGNPFEFDYARFCQRRNIFHQQFCSADKLRHYRKAGKIPVNSIAACHDFCQQQLDKYVSDTTTRGILQAMLLGNENDFDPALRQAYAETGVIHIVSISGSHIGVLFFVVTALLFWLKGKKGQIIKYLAGVAIIWLYVLMAGAPPSAVRSAVMFSIIALSTITGQQTHPLNTLLAAAFILLIANPMFLFTVGFQLSFAAVLSIILFFRPIYHTASPVTKAGKWLWTAVSASIAAELLTAPLSIYYFHNFPLFFLVANILAAVLLGIIALTGGIAIILCCRIPLVATAIGHAITWMVKSFNYLIVHIQSWSPVSFRFIQISFTELVLLYAIIAALAVFFIHRTRKALPVAAGLACALLFLFCHDKYGALQQDRLVVYNISRQHVLEHIKGHYSITSAATADHYINTQARTGWHAWRKRAERAHNAYFTFKGKKIFLLREAIALDTPFSHPVDVLIAERPLKNVPARALQRIFHPKKLIASSLQPRWLMQQWKDSCAAIGQPFHTVTLDGAFVLE